MLDVEISDEARKAAKVTLAKHRFNNCGHQFIVFSKRISERSESASQMICQFCCFIKDVQDMHDDRAEFNRLQHTVSETSESRKNDDNLSPDT